MAEKISGKQIITTIVLFFMGARALYGTGAFLPEAQELLAQIIAAAAAAVFFLCFIFPLKKFPNISLFEIAENTFGKYLGKLISLVLFAVSAFMGAIYLRALAEFAVTTDIHNSRFYTLAGAIAAVCIFMARRGVQNVFRVSYLMFVFIILCAVLYVVASIENFKMPEFVNPLANGFEPIYKRAIWSLSSIFIQVYIFIAAASIAKVRPKSSKYLWAGFIISAVIIFITDFRNLLILGDRLASKTYFPSHASGQTIEIANFIERGEILISVALFASSFLTIASCILSASGGISQVIGVEYKKTVIPVGVFIFALSLFAFGTSLDFFNILPIMLKTVLTVIISLSAVIGVFSLTGKKRDGNRFLPS